MAEYIERTEKLMLAMNAGARAIENTKRYHGAVYTKDVFSKKPQEIPYLQAAKVLRETSDTPAADVAPVVHGRWLHTDWAYHWTSLDKCSVCDYHDEKRQHLGNYSYCPNCGAKMDGGDGDAAD